MGSFNAFFIFHCLFLSWQNKRNNIVIYALTVFLEEVNRSSLVFLGKSEFVTHIVKHTI